MRNTWSPILAALAISLAACGGTEATPAAGAGSGGGTVVAGTADPVAVRSLPEALAQARETGRNVLVVYGRKTCPYSRKMDEQTLSDAGVKEAMAALVYLRVEQGENADEFEDSWGRQPTPTVVTLDAEGRPLGRMVNGVVSPSDFLAYVAWARTGEGPQPGLAVGGG